MFKSEVEVRFVALLYYNIFILCYFLFYVHYILKMKLLYFLRRDHQLEYFCIINEVILNVCHWVDIDLLYLVLKDYFRRSLTD